MLPKVRRLNSKEVEIAMKIGRRSSTGLFSLHIVPSSVPKVAVIIPKKVAKTSVLRHKHKRRIMNALMNLSVPSAHTVITLRQDISKLNFKELCDHISDRIAQ